MTNDNHPKKNLIAYREYVAWLQYDGNDWEVYLYNGTTTKKITNNTTDESNLTIELSLGNAKPSMAWVGKNNSASEIFYYNPSPTSTEITTASTVPSFTIFPNPSNSSEVHVILETPAYSGRICLLNSLGGKVAEQKLNGAEYSFSMEEIPNGMYFVRIDNGSAIGSKAIMILR